MPNTTISTVAIMIDEALLIAELDTALYRQQNRWHIVRMENGQLLECARDLTAILDHPAEKRYLSPPPTSVDELKACLQLWSRRHELLQCLLMGMDSICSTATRQEALALAEQLFNQPELADFASVRLLGCSLPDAADITTAIELSAPYIKINSIYNELQQSQAYIPTVRRLLESLMRYDFEISCDADDLLPAMVDEGLIASAVRAVTKQNRAQVEALLFNFLDNKALKAIEPRIRGLLTAFTKLLLKQFDYKTKEFVQTLKVA